MKKMKTSSRTKDRSLEIELLIDKSSSRSLDFLLFVQTLSFPLEFILIKNCMYESQSKQRDRRCTSILTF